MRQLRKPAVHKPNTQPEPTAIPRFWPVVDLAEAAKHDVFATLIQWMPNAEKRECINLGVFLIDRRTGFVGLRTTTDDKRLLAFDPRIDLDYVHGMLKEIQHDITDAASLVRFCDKLPDITANCFQVLPLAGVISSNPAGDLDIMGQRYLVTPRLERAAVRPSATASIRRKMSSTFQRYGVWSSMNKKLAVNEYVHASRLKIDCAYMASAASTEHRQFKMFHALDVDNDRDRVSELVTIYPEFSKKLQDHRNAQPVLNIICRDFTATPDEIDNAPYDALHDVGINTYRVHDLAMLAATARQDLGLRRM